MVLESHREDEEIERVTACFGNLRKSHATPTVEHTNTESIQHFVEEKLTLDINYTRACSLKLTCKSERYYND